MSALGHKRTFRSLRPMSALPPKADIGLSRVMSALPTMIDKLVVHSILILTADSFRFAHSQKHLSHYTQPGYSFCLKHLPQKGEDPRDVI
jgi:hypothetical protein